MIAGLVLAAGTSSRLGTPKQLLVLGGSPLLGRVVAAALASPLDEVVVVLGHRADEVARVVPEHPRVRVVLNPDYARGQSTSLRKGLEALGPEVSAAVILLGDQPGIRPDAVRAVVEAFRAGAGPVVHAAYGGRPGHPTLLAREVWEEVAAEASGDEGARGVLRRHPEWRILIELGGDPPLDIDTKRDYERARELY